MVTGQNFESFQIIQFQSGIGYCCSLAEASAIQKHCLESTNIIVKSAVVSRKQKRGLLAILHSWVDS